MGGHGVPAEVGDALRTQRTALGLRQLDIARAIGTTRAYVSSVERGVVWEPDAEKMVSWAQALGWPSDHLLRLLGRMEVPEGLSAQRSLLTPEVLALIRSAVTMGVREGVALAMAGIASSDAGEEPSN